MQDEVNFTMFPPLGHDLDTGVVPLRSSCLLRRPNKLPISVLDSSTFNGLGFGEGHCIIETGINPQHAHGDFICLLLGIQFTR